MKKFLALHKGSVVVIDEDKLPSTIRTVYRIDNGVPVADSHERLTMDEYEIALSEALDKHGVKVENAIHIDGAIGFLQKPMKEGELYPLPEHFEVQITTHSTHHMSVNVKGACQQTACPGKFGITIPAGIKFISESERDTFALEFADFIECERWKIDHREQRTHTLSEILEQFKQSKR